MNMPLTKARDRNQWIEGMARVGYASKGLVYVLVGVLTVQAAIRWGGDAKGSTGALQAIATKPFGSVLLALVGLGLAGYTLWRFIQAIYNPGHDDSGAKAAGRRIAYAVNGLIYGSMAFFSFRTAFGSGSSSSGGGSSSSQQVATLLSQPFGQFLVALIGAASAGYAFYCFYHGIKTKFRESLKLHEMSATEVNLATHIGQFGYIAKGIVAIIISYFFVQAARFADPDRAKTTEGVLESLEQQPFGDWLMGLLALGLFAYGIHMLVQARYRRIEP